MANITIKRNTGGAYEALYPRTIITQLFDTDGTTTLFDAGKLKDGYLPSYIFGGMRLAGTYALNGSTATTLQAIFGSWTDGTQSKEENGTYYVVTTGGLLDTNSTLAGGNVYKIRNTSSSDEGDSGDPITVEAGDWIVYTGYDADTPSSGLFTFYFGIVNNTYRDATSSVKGIVQLSSSTTTATTGDKAVTDGILNGLIGTTSGKIAAGDHNHNGTYQAADGDLTALAALTGTGFVKRTGTDTYTLDTNTYLTSQSSDFGTVTVTDTDSGFTWAATGSAVADSTGDTLTMVSGTGIDIDVATASDAVRVTHSDTSTLSGAYGTSGIAAITVDGLGHITAITTATYSGAYTLPLAADGTRGGVQIGFTSTETNRALLLSSEKGYVSLPRQIPEVTLNGSVATSPSFYAPTGAGLTGSTTQTKQRLNSVTGAAPTWIDAPNIYYNTTTNSTLGDLCLIVE